MANTPATPKESPVRERHEFGRGVIRELAKYLYKSPKSAFKEAVSNALDQMAKDNARVEIYTDVLPDGDIVIEDWGTGIEDFERFKHIAIGDKIVDGRVSSYQIIDKNIIGQKGLGKLSLLNLSSIATVEFYSHSKNVGMKIVMTDELDGFTCQYLNNIDALPHPGVKVVIKQARKKLITEGELIKYLSKVFPIRIERGTKIFVNDNRVTKPEGFDSEYPLFQLDEGTWVKGNLKVVEKPQLNNLDIFVKNVYVDSKGFDFKVEGWLNYNKLQLTSSRDAIHEEGVEYEKFIQCLTKYLEENYEKKKTENKEQHVKAEKQLGKMFVNVISSIREACPDMPKPLMAGSPSGEIGTGTSCKGNDSDPCTEQKGIIDKTNTAELTIAKPIGGGGKGHKGGSKESMCRITKGDGRILAPSHVLAFR